MNTVRLDISDNVAEVVLDRPDKLNAVNPEMLSDLQTAFGEAEGAGVRALVLRGEGRGFCAGRDLGDAKPGTEDAEAILAEINPLFSRLAEFPAPTFASVHGPALGVGLGLALACDVVCVADDAKIGSPFARIGAVLDSGGHHHFVQRVGPHRALELIYTGRLLSGSEAASWGLVNAAVPGDELLDTVRSMAATVAQGPTAAFQLSKQLVSRIQREGLSLEDVLAAEAKLQGEASRTVDYAEGIGAFQEKRTPKFTGN
ncbi:MAG: 2-(1,2-epoxy,2-dihydrophenyl)acetyl-CoA isomerase [Actinomycetota bacterium]|jgi:enoyl-CoA hydratase/carnithine racemase